MTKDVRRLIRKENGSVPNAFLTDFPVKAFPGSGEDCFSSSQWGCPVSSGRPDTAASRVEGIFLPAKDLTFTFTWMGTISSPEMGDGGGACQPKTSVFQVTLGFCNMEQIRWEKGKKQNKKAHDKIITCNLSVKKQVREAKWPAQGHTARK